MCGSIRLTSRSFSFSSFIVQSISPLVAAISFSGRSSLNECMHARVAKCSPHTVRHLMVGEVVHTVSHKRSLLLDSPRRAGHVREQPERTGIGRTSACDQSILTEIWGVLYNARPTLPPSFPCVTSPNLSVSQWSTPPKTSLLPPLSAQSVEVHRALPWVCINQTVPPQKKHQSNPRSSRGSLCPRRPRRR